MKTEQDWQARALEVADHCRDVLDPERILTFAREYAAELQTESDAFAAVIQNDGKQLAEALAEVERLRKSERSNEDQLVRIANFTGRDATKAPAHDMTVAGATIELVAELRAQVERLKKTDEDNREPITLQAIVSALESSWDNAERAKALRALGIEVKP